MSSKLFQRKRRINFWEDEEDEDDIEEVNEMPVDQPINRNESGAHSDDCSVEVSSKDSMQVATSEQSESGSVTEETAKFKRRKFVKTEEDNIPLPDPFPLPKNFRKDIETALKLGKINQQTKAAFYSAVGSTIFSYKRYPSASEYIAVARSITSKYPFLKSPVGSTHVSYLLLLIFIGHLHISYGGNPQVIGSSIWGMAGTTNGQKLYSPMFHIHNKHVCWLIENFFLSLPRPEGKGAPTTQIITPLYIHLLC